MTVSIKPSQTEQTERKTCGMPIHLRHKKHRNKYMTTGVLCGSWDCEKCRPYLMKKWITHLSLVLIGLSDMVLVSSIPSRKWGAFRVRLQRAGALYLRIERTDGTLLVIATAGIGKPTSPVAAIELVKQAINNAPITHRPVHTSRKWGLKASQPQKLSEWERVGKIGVSMDEASTIAIAAGLLPSHFWSDQQSGFIVDLPDDWLGIEDSDARCHKLFSLLGGEIATG